MTDTDTVDTTATDTSGADSTDPTTGTEPGTDRSSSGTDPSDSTDEPNAGSDQGGGTDSPSAGSDPAGTDPSSSTDSGGTDSGSSTENPSGSADPSSGTDNSTDGTDPSGADPSGDNTDTGSSSDQGGTDNSTGGTDPSGTDSGSGSGSGSSSSSGPGTGSGSGKSGSSTGGSGSQQSTSGNYIATLFTFKANPGESVGARIVRCCNQALSAGPMGQTQRSDFYRDFIACNQEKTQQAAQALTGVKTSCAMFVRAVREWCGAPAVGPYKPGTGMFVSLGNVSLASPAFVKASAGAKPNPGDYFYIASSQTSNDGHTGIFVSQNPDGSWQTAEGGGAPDGTTCRLTSRTISGTKFTNDARTLWGWFDCTKVGLPAS